MTVIFPIYIFIGYKVSNFCLSHDSRTNLNTTPDYEKLRHDWVCVVLRITEWTDNLMPWKYIYNYLLDYISVDWRKNKQVLCQSTVGHTAKE